MKKVLNYLGKSFKFFGSVLFLEYDIDKDFTLLGALMVAFAPYVMGFLGIVAFVKFIVRCVEKIFGRKF